MRRELCATSGAPLFTRGCHCRSTTCLIWWMFTSDAFSDTQRDLRTLEFKAFFKSTQIFFKVLHAFRAQKSISHVHENRFVQWLTDFLKNRQHIFCRQAVHRSDITKSQSPRVHVRKLKSDGDFSLCTELMVTVMGQQEATSIAADLGREAPKPAGVLMFKLI